MAEWAYVGGGDESSLSGFVPEVDVTYLVEVQVGTDLSQVEGVISTALYAVRPLNYSIHAVRAFDRVVQIEFTKTFELFEQSAAGWIRIGLAVLLAFGVTAGVIRYHRQIDRVVDAGADLTVATAGAATGLAGLLQGLSQGDGLGQVVLLGIGTLVLFTFLPGRR